MIDVSVFAHIGDGALVIDHDRRCVSANDVALSLLGVRTNEQLIGKLVEDIVPLAKLRDEEAWRDFMRSGAFEAVLVVAREDGAKRSIHCRAHARVDSMSHLIVLRDITAQTDELERVESERARLHAILDDLPIAVVVFAAEDFRIRLANQAYLAMVGREDAIGLTLDQVVPDVSPESIYAYISNVKRGKKPLERREHPLMLPGPDGPMRRYFTNKFQPILDGTGEVSQVLVTVLDVTHEVRARSLVDEAAERLRVILDEMPVGANVRDANTGQLLISNKASTHILGLDLSGHSVDSINARFPDGRVLASDDHAFRRAMLTRKPVSNQIVVLNRVTTNEELVVRSSAAIVEGPDSIPLVVSVIEDITAEHRLLAEHEQTARFAERFVGILAHDLRTPLSAIMMGAELLAQKLAHSPQEAPLIRRIASSASRMAEMVTQLLDLTRSRLAGGVPVERKPVDLVGVLVSVLDEIAIANPSVVLSRVLPEVLVGNWDGARLAQVVSNLVGNAVQHGDRAHPIVVALEQRGDSALFTVQSRGEVISEDVLRELFDPFRRLAPTRRGRSAGLGLGLYITRAIVSAHGGEITASSTQEHGTVFTIVLPRSDSPG